jgi:hypothetical protein
LEAKIEFGESSFANYLRRLLIVARGDEGAMPQVPGIRPFDECDLADQVRFDPAALTHFLCSQRLAPPRGPFLRQIPEGTPGSLQCLKSREELIPNSRDEAVLYLGDEMGSLSS